MARTARDLIKRAAQTAGVVDPAESLEDGESSQALDELNNILEEWSLDELFAYVNDTFTSPLSLITEGEIIVGPTTGSVDIETPRPNRVKAVALLTDGRYAPLTYISPDDYATSTIRNGVNNSGLPTYYTVLMDNPDIRIIILGDTSGYQFNITSQRIFQAYTLNDEILLPTGYYPALQYSLAMVLAGIYGNLEVVPVLEREATKRIARIKRLNTKPRHLTHQGTPGMGCGEFDIQTRSFYS